MLKRRTRVYILLFVHNLLRNGRYVINNIDSDDMPARVNERQLCDDVMHRAFHPEGLRRARHLRRPRRRRGRRARGDRCAQRLVRQTLTSDLSVFLLSTPFALTFARAPVIHSFIHHFKIKLQKFQEENKVRVKQRAQLARANSDPGTELGTEGDFRVET